MQETIKVKLPSGLLKLRGEASAKKHTKFIIKIGFILKNKELAELLGVSAQMVGRHVKRGMPTSSLEAAIEWRKKHLNPFTTKSGRAGGNDGKQGVVGGRVSTSDGGIYDPVKDVVTYTLTSIMPQLWFSQPGLLSVALGAAGVTVSGEKLLKVQQLLFCMYTNRIDEFLKTDARYESPEYLWFEPGSDEYRDLISALDRIDPDPSRLS